MVEFFHFLKTSKFDDIKTMCFVKLFIKTFVIMIKVQPKYNVIISKSKTLVELEG
jgi:hypothetical protein